MCVSQSHKCVVVLILLVRVPFFLFTSDMAAADVALDQPPPTLRFYGTKEGLESPQKIEDKTNGRTIEFVDVEDEKDHRSLFGTESVNVFRCKLAGGRSVGWHRHSRPTLFLLGTTSPTQIDQVGQKEKISKTFQAGEVLFANYSKTGCIHTVHSVSAAAPFDGLEVENLRNCKCLPHCRKSTPLEVLPPSPSLSHRATSADGGREEATSVISGEQGEVYEENECFRVRVFRIGRPSAEETSVSPSSSELRLTAETRPCLVVLFSPKEKTDDESATTIEKKKRHPGLPAFVSAHVEAQGIIGRGCEWERAREDLHPHEDAGQGKSEQRCEENTEGATAAVAPQRVLQRCTNLCFDLKNELDFFWMDVGAQARIRLLESKEEKKLGTDQEEEKSRQEEAPTCLITVCELK